MIQKPPTKKQIRDELSKQVEDFLGRANITQIPRGVSGRDPCNHNSKPESWQFEKNDQQRTYVPEVIDALEQRKHPIKTVNKTKKKPRKRLIYDDFGEPLRWVWIDE